MLDICLIKDDESMDDVKIKDRRISSVDLVDFYAMRRYWKDVSDICGVRITYFNDSILRTDDVKMAKEILCRGKYNDYYFGYWNKIFDICLGKDSGLLFVCD